MKKSEKVIPVCVRECGHVCVCMCAYECECVGMFAAKGLSKGEKVLEETPLIWRQMDSSKVCVTCEGESE